MRLGAHQKLTLLNLFSVVLFCLVYIYLPLYLLAKSSSEAHFIEFIFSCIVLFSIHILAILFIDILNIPRTIGMV